MNEMAMILVLTSQFDVSPVSTERVNRDYVNAKITRATIIQRSGTKKTYVKSMVHGP